MNLVVDTNVLMTYFWKQSVIHEIVKLPIHFISPQYALKKIQNHKQEIITKSNCSSQTFQKKSEQLVHTIDFIPLEIYASFVKKVTEIFDKTSQKKYESFMKDSDFYALALYAESPIWTNDKLFKEQDEIVVFTTKEVIKLCRHLI